MVELTSTWAAPLQDASFDDIPFLTNEYDYVMDRRTVVHSFPFRDLPLVEDLGLGVQTLSISGYIIGDDVYDQRDNLIERTKQPDEAELIHPSLGSLTCTLVAASFSESADDGRMVSIRLNFIVTNDPKEKDDFWQSITPDEPGFIQDAVDDVNDAIHSDFVQGAISDVKSGIATVKSVVKQVQSYVKLVTNVMGDATKIIHSVDGLANIFPGFTGSRYAHRGLGGTRTSINTAIGDINLVTGTFNKITTGANSLLNSANRGISDVQKLGTGLEKISNLF